MGVFIYKTHIRYQDITEQNKLADKGILSILSEAAGAHAKTAGNSLNELEKTGYAWMLLYWKIKVSSRPRWNEELTIKTWPRKFEKVSSWRDFEVYDENGNLVLIATTNWVLIDTNTGRPARITEDMMNKYGIVPKSVFREEITGKLKTDENEKKIYEYTAARRDIDSNHHVNNVMYLEFAYDAFPDNIELDFNNIEIYYKRQIKIRRNFWNIFI